jgi:serine/threonine protein kinase
VSLSVGDRLGRYEILGPIGAGGMGEVWKALDTELERTVAVKVLPESVAEDPSRLERFQREARALAALSHPNLLDIYDVGSTNGLHYAVTELLEGDTLRQKIPTSGLPWQKVAAMGAAAADGMAAAHGKGIVHRDLKPENLFVTADGRVKILDFGLAKVEEDFDPAGETGTLTPAGTEAGTIMGTPGYMAPEQVKGKPADPRSDIFALGCVLYEMVAGHRAFGGDTGMEVMAAILKEEPPQLSSSGAAVPVDLERAIHRCLEKRPEARFQSSADLAYSLRRIGAGATSPVMATPSGDRSIDGRRWRWWHVAVAALLVVVTAGIAWRMLAPPSSETETADSGTTLDPNRVAVVPFVNRAGDSSLDALCQRAADEIAGQLSEMEDLQVVPPGAVASELAAGPTDAGLDPRILVADVAEGTSAGLVFTGVIDATGDGVELRGVLEDTVAGRVVRAFAPVTADPLSPGQAIRELAKVVYICASDHLHPSLAFGAGEEWPDVETYQEFVKRMRLLDRENFVPFFELFQANPQLTRMRLGVVLAFLDNQSLKSAGEMLDSEHLDEANLNRHQAAVTRALRLWVGGQYDVAYRLFRDELTESPQNTLLRHAAARCALFANRPAATVALCRDRVPDRVAPPVVDVMIAGDAATAQHILDEDQAAVEILNRVCSDVSSTVTDWCLWRQISLLGAVGETERMEALLEETIDRNFVRYDVATARIDSSHELRAHGFHDASDAMAEKALELLVALCGRGPPESCPGLAEAWLKALLITGRNQEAAELAASLDREELSWISAWCLPGIAAARVGDTTTARSCFERLADPPTESDPRFDMTRVGDLKVGQAMIAAQLGELDEALYLLRTGISEGALRIDLNLNLHELRHNIFLEPLWDHPEFQEIMRPKG